jgi:hypothetical protein
MLTNGLAMTIKTASAAFTLVADTSRTATWHGFQSESERDDFAASNTDFGLKNCMRGRAHFYMD